MENNGQVDADGEQKVITMVEFLEEQEELEKEAAEILPGDHDQCTYHQGYIRQPVYVCLTCTPVPTEKEREENNINYAGVCYSCSITCHTSHEVRELFEKRHFCCDCGNQKFKEFKCSLQQEKAPLNEENKYDHNFENKFCYCDEDYNPEVDTRDMYKCIICEDWFHSTCINNLIDPETWKDLICKKCTKNYPVFKKYIDEKLVLTSTKNEENNEPKNKKLKLDQSESSNCKIQNIGEDDREIELYCKEGWKKNLCSCDACFVLFHDLKLEFLLEQNEDPEAENQAENGEREQTSIYEGGMKVFSTMPQQMAVNAAMKTEKLTKDLKEFLRPFAEGGKVVTKEDIEEFFKRKR